MAEKMKLSALLVQSLATFSIAYLTSILGFVFAWPSYTLANFQSDDTVLSRPMTPLDVSLLGSLVNVGALVATPFCGYAVNAIGRKYSAMLVGVPFVVAWLTIAFVKSVPMVIAAIGFTGIGAAGQTIASVYIAEIVQDSIRGAMTSTCVSGYYAGLLFSYAIGGYLSYYQVVYVHLAMSVLYILMIMMLHESPVYLLQIGQEEKAAKSIAFYRRVDVTSTEVQNEIKKIKIQLDPRINKLLESGQDPKSAKKLLESSEGQTETQSSWKFLLNSKSSQHALLAVLMTMTISIMMGLIVLQVYAEPLFKEAIPSMDANLCSIILAMVLLVSSLVCGGMVDRLGRKFLMTVTTAGSGILTLVLGTQLQFHWAPHWATAVFIYAYCLIYNLGAAVVPFVLAGEVFLPEVRGLGCSCTMACMWIMNFITLMIFNPLVDIFGLGPIFYGFSIVSFLGSAYSRFCLPETKGLSSDAIQLLFIKPKRDKKIKSRFFSHYNKTVFCK